MADAAPVLLLTRPRASSERFLRDLAAALGREVEAVISPVLEIVDHGTLPDVTAFETIILSSAHAAHRLGKAGVLRARRVCTVGEAAAELSRQYGADAVALGRDAESFLSQSSSLVPPCIHCRGVHGRGDIAERLSAVGVQTDEAVVYDQRAVDLTEEARTMLASDRKVIAPVFSPRSAALLREQIAHEINLLVVAISPAAADVWGGHEQIRIARSPTSASMVNAVADAF